MDAKRHAAPLAALFAVLLTVLLAAPAPPATAVPPETPPRAASPLRRVMVESHARARRAVGLPPLAWSDALAADARRHARRIADSGRFAHAAQPGGPMRQGENLFAGTRGMFGYEAAAQAWIDERRDFTNAVVPRHSRTGRWQDVAHYAQIVWRRTRQMGCATATGARADYLVCRYWPAGNVTGERAF